MPLNKFLRFLNYLIAVALVGAVALGFWYGYRPLPQTSGSIRTGVKSPVTVDRDALGVPHIRAANLDDLLFAQGFVTAQERLWQMDMLRRFAAGELSEVLGQGGLESDREARRLRLRSIAAEQAARLPEKDRAAVAAYARGVNAYIEQNRGRLPAEFTLLGYNPRPWTIRDTVLVSLVMFRDLTTTWKDELLKANLRAAGDGGQGGFSVPDAQRP